MNVKQVKVNNNAVSVHMIHISISWLFQELSVEPQRVNKIAKLYARAKKKQFITLHLFSCHWLP